MLLLLLLSEAQEGLCNMNKSLFQDSLEVVHNPGKARSVVHCKWDSSVQRLPLSSFFLQRSNQFYGKSDNRISFQPHSLKLLRQANTSAVNSELFLLLLVTAYITPGLDSTSTGGEILVIKSIIPTSNSRKVLDIIINGESNNMTKKRNKNDNQMLLPFEYKEKVKELSIHYEKVGKALDQVVESGPSKTQKVENEMELAQEIVVAIKQDLREADISRETFVDRINEYLGRTTEGADSDPPTCRKKLTLNMLNNYLSKPQKYPIPAFFLYPVIDIFNSYRVINAIVGVTGATVVSGEDIRKLTLLRLQELKSEVAMLEKAI